MPCSDRGFLPVSETLSDFHIGLTIVSGRRPLCPRGSALECLSGPSVRHCLLEWLGSCTGMPAVWGLAVPLVTGLVGLWGGAVLGQEAVGYFLVAPDHRPC